MKTNKEIRARTVDFECRASNKNGKKAVIGYAVRFNEPSVNLGGFIERIAPSAFTDVDMSNVLCLYNHNYDNVLARTDSGTLNLELDNDGLMFEAELSNTTLANDVYANIEARNVKGCSFGFTVAKDSWGKENGQTVRTIQQIGHLSEITLTPIPAYEDTTVVSRSLANYKRQEEELKLLSHYEKIGEQK